MNKLFSLVILILACSAVKAQEERPLMKVFMEKSQYVHKVFLQLLFDKLNAISDPVGAPIPEPMRFDNFTYDHFWLFVSGTSHVYNPLLYGFSDSRLTVRSDINDPYHVNIRLFIPLANLTGTYDLHVVHTSIIPGEIVYTGDGGYNHVFRDVELTVDLTIDDTFNNRTLPTRVTSSLSFGSCSLWADNFYRESTYWDEAKFAAQSIVYKERYDEKAPETDIIISDAVSSYLGTLWGIFRNSKEMALSTLLELNEL